MHRHRVVADTVSGTTGHSSIMGGYANFDIAERIHEKVNLGQFHKWTPSVTDHNQNSAEKTYRAIGRFIFEFSQVEYTIRHYLAQEIRLDDQHFSAVVESYDVGVLCTVATEVFKKSRTEKNAAQIKDLIKKFRSLTDVRNRVAHGLWVPFKDGGTVHHVARTSLTSIPAANQAEALEELADEACKVRAELERAFSTFDI